MITSIERVTWVEPSPAWQGRKLSQLERPRIVEIASDNFLPEFIAAMNSSPADYLDTHVPDTRNNYARLFQPLHGCFYLVTGSLVCRQLGLPDKAVMPQNGERTEFVLRREVDGEEQAWVPDLGWRPLVDAKGRAVVALADEERFPMHPVKTCGGPSLNGDCERVLYHGYLPTGGRDKYQTPAAPFTDPQAYIDEIEAAPDGDTQQEDFRYNEFDTRVIAVWTALVLDGDKISDDPERVHTLSLYLILDLGDYLMRALPKVWAAVLAGNTNSLQGPANAGGRALYNILDDISFTDSDGSPTHNLRQRLAHHQNHLPLAHGEDVPGGEPNVQYDMTTAEYDGDEIEADPQDSVAFLEDRDDPDDDHTLVSAVKAALAEENTPMQLTDEMALILREQVRAEEVTASGSEVVDLYFVRLLYTYDPDCPPIASGRSQLFTFARFFDPDAPARQIRLELPSIKMGDLRKFKKGVGMQMSPELRDVMSRVHKGMLDEEGLNPPQGGWELGMICTFSLQIIFLVAFIVMFIFLILLNIVFWWLPFLKICFPIPKRSS